jgi:hypothetical protein
VFDIKSVLSATSQRLALLLTLVALLLCGPAWAQKRVALVIGNAAPD